MLKIELNEADAAIKSMLNTIKHIKNATPKACARAINSTLREIRKEAVRVAQNTYTARAADISKKAALNKAYPGSLHGKLTIKDKRGLNLINFQARPNRPGVRPPEGASVKIFRQGSRKNPRFGGQKAFVAKGNNGNTLMFVRTKKGAGGLKPLYGPHPIQALSDSGKKSELNEKAEARLRVNLAEEINAVLAASFKGKR